MTWDELRERLSLLMGFPPNGVPVADEAIRLVVEACCADLTALAGPAEGGAGRLTPEARIGVMTAVLRLRQFLPALSAGEIKPEEQNT